MARKANDVELIISAKNESEKAFKDLFGALKEIETAAKKGGGLSELFAGFEQRLATVTAKQKQFNSLIGDTKQIQKAINSAQKFTDVVKAQETALAGAQKELSDLESTYADVEKAANAARTPSEKLSKSLGEQEAKQKSLATAIAETRVELDRSNDALTKNAGLDDKATVAIDKQRAAVIAAGQSWRDTTKAISDARKQIATLTSQRDNIQQSITGSNKSKLEDELRTLKEFVKESTKLSRTQGIGDATKSLTAGASTRIAEVQALLKAERQTQAALANDLSKTTAEIRRQEVAIGKLTTKAGGQKNVYDDLKKSLNQFEASAKADGATRQTANIDKLNASLVTLQANYDETVKKVAATNAALAKGSAPDPRAVAQFDALKQKIDAARVAVQKEQVELNKLSTELKEAGIDTASLTARQKELDIVTERLTTEEAQLATEMKRLGDQAQRTGVNVRNTSSSFLQLGNDTRKSLGFLQRIRGELLSIAATYTGVFAVGGAIRSIYEASVLLNKAEARFNVAFGGDNKKTADEIAFVRKEADRLGISFEVALDQYSKFFSGIPEGSVSLENIRRIFTDFSTAARVGGLGAQELERIFTALTQIFSKQKVSLEELSQQLGDSLPGAVKRTADALGVSPDSLFKQLEQGNVRSEAAILLANELQKAYGTQLPKALKSPAAALEQFNNQLFDLRLELANSGFIDTLTEGLREVTVAIKSPEFRQGAKDLANLLGQIVKVGVVLIQNFDKVKDVLALVFGAKLIGLVNAFRLQIVGAGTAVAALGVNLTKLLPSLGAVTTSLGTFISRLVSIPVLLSGAAGFGIGTYLYKEFDTVKKVAAGIIAYLDALVTSVKAAFAKTKAYLTLSGEERTKRIAQIEEDLGNDLGRIKSLVDDTFSAIDEGLYRETPTIIDPEKVKKDVEAVNKAIVDGLLSPEEIAALQKQALGGGDEEADKKLETLRTKVRDALVDIDREIQEKSGDTLAERLESIRTEYSKLLRQIQQAGGAGQFPNAQKSIDQIVAIKQVEATEKEINSLIQERRTLISNINEQAELGAITVEEASKRINEANSRLIPQMSAALEQARQIAATINSKPVTQSVDNQAQVVLLEQQRAKKEQLLALEEQINRVMELRRERIQTINALVQTGALSEADGRRQILDLNQQTITQLDTIIQQAIVMAEKLGDQSMVERLKQVNIELNDLTEEIVTANEVNQQFADGLTNALFQWADGAMSARDAMRAFFADMLRQIARAIAQWLILKAIQNSGWGGAVSAGVNAGVNHSGGIAGQSNRRRNLPVTAFAGAVKYHSGGVAGLRPNEVPAVLERGEEVLTKNDPRHVQNGGTQQGQSVVPAPEVKVVNMFDTASFISEGLGTSTGVKAVLNLIQANSAQVKSLLR
jgi:tape measure domain-containing protein